MHQRPGSEVVGLDRLRVGQPSQREVLVAGGEPQEVDQHRAAPQQAQDVDDLAPPTQRERCLHPRPALESCTQDRDVPKEVGQVDHRRGRDRYDRGSGEL